MQAPTHWVCPSCRAWVPLALNQCPGCKHVHAAAPVVSHAVYPSTQPVARPWVQAVSIPTALLGIVAFFLPWSQISCGPVTLSFSGYELATGSYEEKLGHEHYDRFERRLDSALDQELKRHGVRKTWPKQAPSQESEREPQTGWRLPLLWIVPGACAVLLLLGVFGLPRIPALLVSLVASAYLAYFGVTTEQQATDPQYTGGFLTQTWMWGFWSCWLGLVAPAVAALLKPRSHS